MKTKTSNVSSESVETGENVPPFCCALFVDDVDDETDEDVKLVSKDDSSSRG